VNNLGGKGLDSDINRLFVSVKQVLHIFQKKILE